MDNTTVQNRRKDLFDNFSRVVDHANKDKPDIFIISGDIFDTSVPSNEALIFFTRKIRELHDKDIKVLLIGGNHDVPKATNKVTMSIDILKNAGIATVLGSSRALHKKRLAINGKSVCISGRSYFATHSNDSNPSSVLESKVPLEGDFNILILHSPLFLNQASSPTGSVTSINNDNLDASHLPSGLNYVALGLNHDHFQLNHNGCKICNAGSIERLQWSEMDQPKGFFWAELRDSGTKAEFNELPTRKMKRKEIDISIQASDEPSNIVDKIDTVMSGNRDKHTIFRLDIKGKIASHKASSLRLNELHDKYQKRFFHLQLDKSCLQAADSSERGPFGTSDNIDDASPINAFIRRIDALASQPTKTEEDLVLLRELKNRGIKYLRSINAE